MKRVPMLMPSQPSASAATRPRASASPPEAIIGILMTLAAAGSSTRLGTSSSPGCPAHSKPSMLMASTPIFSAEMPWRTRRALVDHLDAVLPELRQERLGIVAGRLHDLDAGRDDGVDVFAVGARHERRQDRQVHAERLVGHLAAARDLLHQVLRRRLRQRGQETERAGIGDGRGQLGASDPLHAALHDGVLHPEHLRESRADHRALTYACPVRPGT